MGQWQAGVDVGGTFTDLLFVNEDERRFRVTKVPSTPDDQSRGMMTGIRQSGLAVETLGSIVHGTTVGTNAILERKGVVCGLITTAGFRDVLELGRRTRPFGYGMIGSFEALIPRQLRVEVPERLDARGNVLTPLDEEAVQRAIRLLIAGGAEALVISFLHSYVNPAHEKRAAEIARALWPNPFISVGSDILREVREFERSTTAAVNGYIQPIMARYLGRLQKELKLARFPSELLIMQGNGGTMSGKAAADYAVQTVMSGPAAGALAAARIGQQSGHPNLIGCDMGGTSFDVTLIRAGEPALSAEKDIAYGVPIRVPMIDIHTIGAGGGSIARITKAGILQVGPDSAGANPGPICYGRGGTEPTVTDANLVLGKLDPAALPGVAGGVSIDDGAGRDRRQDRPPARARRHRGGRRDHHRRQRSTGERHPPGVDRERLRSARLRALPVRRRGASPCRGLGARARRADGAGTALSRPHLSVGLHLGRPPARFRAHA